MVYKFDLRNPRGRREFEKLKEFLAKLEKVDPKLRYDIWKKNGVVYVTEAKGNSATEAGEQLSRLLFFCKARKAEHAKKQRKSIEQRKRGEILHANAINYRKRSNLQEHL